MAENPANPFLTPTEENKVPSPTRPLSPPETSGSSLPPLNVVQPKSFSPSPKQTTEIKGPSLGVPRALSTDVAPSRRKWLWRWVIVVLLLLLLGFGAYRWWLRSRTNQASVDQVNTTQTSSPTTPSTTTVTADAPPVILDDNALYKSENFKAGEIVFLGEAQFLQGDEGIAPLSLDSIRGEAFTEKNKKEVKLVITWKTNKLSQAEISYAKGIGQAPKIASEDDYSYNHSVILTGLDPASTYLYTVKATDRFGNVATSEPYAVFTGARSVSLFDLIAGAIGDVFGWAVK